MKRIHRKNNKSRVVIISALLAFTLCFTVAYSAFSTNLSINTKGNVKNLEYTVTFDPNGGTVDVNSKKVKYGHAYGKLPTPVRKGYIFKGWNGKNMFDESTSSIGFLFPEEGTIDENNDAWKSSNFIECKAKKVYTFSYKNKHINFYQINIVYYDIDKKYIMGKNNSPNHNINYFSLESPEKAKYMKISYSILVNGLETGGFEYQLEEGSLPPKYEPFYINEDTTVVQKQDHTLTAIWQQNTQ